MLTCWHKECRRTWTTTNFSWRDGHTPEPFARQTWNSHGTISQTHPHTHMWWTQSKLPSQHWHVNVANSSFDFKWNNSVASLLFNCFVIDWVKLQQLFHAWAWEFWEWCFFFFLNQQCAVNILCHGWTAFLQCSCPHSLSFQLLHSFTLPKQCLSWHSSKCNFACSRFQTVKTQLSKVVVKHDGGEWLL